MMGDQSPAAFARAARVAGLGLALCFLTAMVGCSAKLTPPPPPDSYQTYRVGAPDVLLVNVLPEPVITRSVVVRPDGMFSLDLVGDVPAEGRSIEEIAADLQTRMRRFKRGATVSVALQSANSTEITILGEVRSPRSFPLVKRTRVAEAIGLVGGVRLFARKFRRTILRNFLI